MRSLSATAQVSLADRCHIVKICVRQEVCQESYLSGMIKAMSPTSAFTQLVPYGTQSVLV
jgi:hypothetical protein